MDWSSIISTGISAVGNFFGNLFGGNQQLKATREYNQAQKELAEYQNEWNLEMWNKQNDYNSPIAQMQRYQDAGLNPNLIYSQGSPGNASSPPSAATPDYQLEDRSYRGRAISEAVNNAVNTYAQSIQNQKIKREISFMDTQADAVSAQTEKTLIESIGLEQDNLMKMIHAEWLPREKKLDYLNQWQDLQNRKTRNMIDQLDYQFNLRTFENRVRSTFLSNRESEARIDNLISSTNLNDIQKEVLKGQLSVQQAQIQNLLSQAGLYSVQAENAWNEFAAFSIRLSNEIAKDTNTVTSVEIKNKIDSFLHTWNLSFGLGGSDVAGVVENILWQGLKKQYPGIYDSFKLN